MGSFLFTAVSFVVALGVLITVHEFGHFWVARRLGVKVLRFSIGFGKPLLRWSGKDDTEYVVAALPLGGYVKMLDEREEPVPEPELPHAFNRQSLPVRSAIVVAGPLFNFLFAIFAYWAIFVGGDTGLKPLVGEVAPQSIAAEAGFKPSDEILDIDGKETPAWESVIYALLEKSLGDKDLQVRVRDAEGVEDTRILPGTALRGLTEDGQLLENLGLTPKRPVVPPVIGDVLKGEAAATAGLEPGDRIITADGKPMESWGDWVEYVRARPEKPIGLVVARDGLEIEVTLTPAALEQNGEVIGRIGASVEIPERLFEEYRVEVKYGPVAAIGVAARKTWDLSALTLKVIGKMLLGEMSVKNLSGPISIAESAGKSASYGINPFLKFLAVVSVSLGVLNLLPIPVLDGGHLLFFLIEAVKGSPLSEEAQMQAQKIGIILLLALMTLAFYVDLSRLLG